MEDEAYYLLGFLGVNMPLLRGEGQKAFTRLQHEIMQVSSGLTISARGLTIPYEQAGDNRIIASSASSYRSCGSLRRPAHPPSNIRWQSNITLTNAALRVKGPVLLLKSDFIALVLDCY